MLPFVTIGCFIVGMLRIFGETKTKRYGEVRNTHR